MQDAHLLGGRAKTPRQRGLAPETKHSVTSVLFLRDERLLATAGACLPASFWLLHPLHYCRTRLSDLSCLPTDDKPAAKEQSSAHYCRVF